MTYQDRFFAHVKKVEDLVERIGEWEQWAHQQVEDKHGDMISKGKDTIERANIRAHFMSQILGATKRYGSDVGARNTALQMAQMYGFAALLEQIDEMDHEPAASGSADARTGPDDYRSGPTVRV